MKKKHFPAPSNLLPWKFNLQFVEKNSMSSPLSEDQLLAYVVLVTSNK